jgi:hypothetical protein
MVSFTPRRFPRKAPCTHWIGGWVGPRIGLDVVAERKILPFRESNPDRPAGNLVVTLPTELRLSALPVQGDPPEM